VFTLRGNFVRYFRVFAKTELIRLFYCILLRMPMRLPAAVAAIFTLGVVSSFALSAPHSGLSSSTSNSGAQRPAANLPHTTSPASGNVSKGMSGMIDLRNKPMILGNSISGGGTQPNNNATRMGAGFALPTKTAPMDPELFTSKWSAEHPNAWQPTSEGVDYWAMPTEIELIGWLGWPEESADSTAGQKIPNSPPASIAPTPETGDAESSKHRVANAPSTVGPTETKANGEVCFPLGVFRLAPAGQEEAHLILQLVIKKDGTLAGNYCDLISDQATAVEGQVDRKSRRVSFHVGTRQTANFEADLADLTADVTPLFAVYSDHHVQNWLMTRVQAPKP
jgi:hypothetical protein